MDRFHHLSKGLALILGFIGVKLVMQASHEVISTAIPEINSLLSLAVIVIVLGVSVVLSVVRPAPSGGTGEQPGADTSEAASGPPGDSRDTAEQARRAGRDHR